MGADAGLTLMYSQNAACGPSESFGGKGPPFIDYEQQVRLWRRVANLDPSKRAAASILRIDTVARQVCLAAGSDFVVNNDGAERIVTILKDYIAPDAADSVDQEVARFLQSKRPGRTMDVHLAEFDLLRRKAESKMQMSGPRPKHLYTCRA